MQHRTPEEQLLAEAIEIVSVLNEEQLRMLIEKAQKRLERMAPSPALAENESYR